MSDSELALSKNSTLYPKPLGVLLFFILLAVLLFYLYYPVMVVSENAELVESYVYPLHFGIDFCNKQYIENEFLFILKVYPEKTGFLRPITSLSLYLDYLLWFDNYFGYHLSTLLFHFAACLALFFLLRKFNIRGGALFIPILVFALHPISAHAVSTSMNRTDILATMFLLFACLNALTYLDTGKKTALIFTGVLFTAGLLSKEIALSFPFLILGIKLMQRKQSSKESWIRLGVVLGICCSLIISFLIVRYMVVGQVLTNIYIQKLELAAMMRQAIANGLRIGYHLFNVTTFTGAIIRFSAWSIFGAVIITGSLLYLFIVTKNLNIKLGILWIYLAAIPIYHFGWVGLWYLYLPLVGVAVLFAGILEFVQQRKTLRRGVLVIILLGTLVAADSSMRIIKKVSDYCHRKELYAESFAALFPYPDLEKNYFILQQKDYADKGFILYLCLKYDKADFNVRWVRPSEDQPVWHWIWHYYYIYSENIPDDVNNIYVKFSEDEAGNNRSRLVFCTKADMFEHEQNRAMRRTSP